MVLGILKIHMQNNEIGLIAQHLKNQLKMDQRFLTRPKSISLLDEYIREKLCDIGLGNDSLDMTTKAEIIKAKINKCPLKMFQTKKQTNKNISTAKQSE